MTARDRRAARILCLWLALAGAACTWLVWSGAVLGGDAGLAFPVSAAGGIVGLWALRPRTEKARPEEGPGQSPER